MAINERATVEVQVNGQQAKQELRDLESYANSLKGRLAEAHKAGDTKQIKKLEAELRKTNAEMKVMRTNTKNIDVAMNNIGLATPKELKQLLKDINTKLNSGHIKRGSEEWRRYQAQLKQVNAELKKVNDETKETESWLTRFNNKFSKWGALAASAIAAITGVSLALSKMRSDRNAKESSAANLKALTGLDDTSIQWLTRQAEILSTAMDKTGLRVTQSSKDILEAYMLVGSAKPDLLEDKEALNAVTVEAMRLSVAAKMDLKEAVDAVTLSMNQYGAASDEAAKYTNVMAAGSKFGSASVQSITAAVTKAGVSASGANVSIEELVASIEALGEKGIKDEVAGTGLKMFFLRLQTGADETNPRVVGLQKALQNLQKLSVDEVVKRFGAETFTVAKTLIDGAEKVDYYTKAVTGTNVAMEQAAINSDTAEAKMAQLKNEIKEAGIKLMEKLNPSLSILMGWSTKLIKAAPALIDWFKEYGKVLAYAVIVLASYTAANKLQWFWINRVKTETGQYIVIQKLKQFWDKAVAASTWLYIAATSALTGKTRQAGLAMQAFFMILKLNPFGAIATLVVAVAGAIYLLGTRTKKAKSILGEFLSTFGQERNELSKIYNQLLKTNEKTAERTKLINEFNSQFGNYLTNLLSEKSTVEDIKKAYREATAAMNDHYARELLASKQAEIVKENLENQSKSLSGSIDIAIAATKEQKAKLAELISDVTNQVITDNPTYGIGNVRQKIYEAINREFGAGASYDLFGGSEGWEDFQKKIFPFIKATDDTINRVNKLKEELAPFLKNLSGTGTETTTTTNDDKTCKKCGNNPCTCKKGLSDKEKQKKLKEALKKAEADAAKAEADIKARYASGELAYRDFCQAINENAVKELDAKMLLYDKESNEFNQLLSKKQDLLQRGLEQETKFTIDEIEARAKAEEMFLIDSYYNQKINKYALNEGLFQLDMDTLQKKQALYTKDSKEWHEYEKQISNLENNEKLQKQKEFQDMLSAIREQYSKKNLDQFMQEEMDGLDYLYKNGILKEEEYQKLLKSIKLKYLKEGIDQIDKPSGDGGISTEKPTSEWQKLKDKYALINKAEEGNAITHQQALQRKAEADAAYLDDLQKKMQMAYSAINGIVSAYSEYTNACQDLEIAKVEKKYDAEIEAAGSSTTKGKRLEEQKQKETAKIKSKYNKKAMQIEISQALVGTAMSAINAYSSAAQVPLIGYILAPIAAAAAVATGMLQVATIRKQHQAQQTGYYEGGFTSKGDYRKEAGVVHQGEFVANHQTVNNPNVMPVLRLIDNAQRNNTVGSLTARDITNSLRGYNNGGFVSTGSNDHTAGGADNESLLNMIGYTSSVIEKLEKRLNEPFLTVNTVDGEHGIKQAMDKYEQTIKIKSR